ncbi:MAG: class I SAM-dependent methyltransferase, partial [Deltaproteobacteria bacterium]|nr:class I SAM-dependent methyltransferase [Deltaproteobacteria bacterium]
MNQSHTQTLNASMCRCLLCKSPGLEHLVVSESFGINIVQCVSCGLIQSEYVSPSALNDYYSEFYRGPLSPEDIETLRSKSRAQADAQMAYIAPFMSDRALENALDYGAADGELALRLKDISRTVYVTEADPQYASLLKDRNELMLINDHDLENKRYHEFFDFISLSHVLEHLPDPVSSLDNFSRVLKKDGLMLVDIPNETELLLRFNFQAEGHLTFFTLDTFRSLVQTHGKFNILEMHTCNRSVEEYIQSGLTLPEDYSRHHTPNGTVIRAILQNTQPAQMPAIKMEDVLDYRLLLDDYSRRILELHRRLGDLQNKGKKINERPVASPDGSWKNSSASPIELSYENGLDRNNLRKRLQIDIPSSQSKKFFIMDLDLNHFSHKMI